MSAKAKQPLLTPDELNAIENASSPSISNVFITDSVMKNISETLSSSWTLGEVSDQFYYFYANITTTPNKPGIRYNKQTFVWEFSNNGTDWQTIGVLNNFFDKDNDTTDDIVEGIKKFLTDDSVSSQHLDAFNSPQDENVLTWNSSEGKFEWIDISTLVTPQDTTIGIPADGTYEDGLLPFTPSTERADAFDEINEVLKELVPEAPPTLGGSIGLPITVSGKISGNTVVSGIRLDSYVEGQQIATITTQDTFIKDIPDFGQADEGRIEAHIDGIKEDEFDIGTSFDELERVGSQSYTPEESSNKYLKINSVEKYNNFSKWQIGDADLQIGLTYGNTNLSNGEHDYLVKHIIGATENGVTDTSRIFVDKETARPNISSTPQITEFSGSFKYLSGVKIYGIGSSFKADFDAEKCFEYTYIDAPINVSMQGITSFDMPFTDSSISGVTLPVPEFDEVITCVDKDITLNVSNVLSDNARLTIIPRDPHGNGVASQSASENRLVNTYGNVSTDSVEYFVDENRRLPNGNYDSVPVSIINQWVSSDLLTNGNAQVYNHYLKYPEDDYTAVLPQQILDYSGFTGDQVYTRAFKDSTGHQSGNLILSGITESDLNTNVRVEIKLPSVTGWLDLGVGFNAATYSASDGDGCRTSSSGSDFGWTSGGSQYSTVFSGNMIIVKVTLLNNVKSINQVNATWV